MEDRPDLYVILGIAPSASSAEVQGAYRQRVQVLHPDRFDRRTNPVAWEHANIMLRELNEAFAVLSDPVRRRDYDLASEKSTKSPPSASASRPRPAPHQSDSSSAETANRRSVGIRKDFTKLISVGALLALAAFAVGALLAVLFSGESPRRAKIDTPSDWLQNLPRRGSDTPADDGTDPRLVRIRPFSECETGTEPQALPENGRVWRLMGGDPIAPLEIRLRGTGNYLVKVERDGHASAIMFVRAGSTATMMLPLGAYTLKYATGGGESWCGEAARLPFGGGTSFYRADKVFSFRNEGGRLIGYTVELAPLRDGNLPYSSLPPSNW